MIRLIILEHGTPRGWVTVGTWYFTRANNKGNLVVEVSELHDQRYMWAVIGHELIEALYCKLFHRTTEQCDRFDEWMEEEYASGRIDRHVEGGFHWRCPYRTGHILGFWWEWLVIHLTLGSWKKYDDACNKVMGLS